MGKENPFHQGLSETFIREYIDVRRISPRSLSEFLDSLKEEDYGERTIQAFSRVDRGKFVPKSVPPEYVYSQASWCLHHKFDHVSISEPDVVAQMTRELAPKEGDDILEVGTGTGYQAAILASLVGNEGHIVTCDIYEDLIALASENLGSLGIKNVTLVNTDGSVGYEASAPYNRIIVTASLAPFFLDEKFPLFDQVAKGGRLVAPLGGFGNMRDCRLLTVDRNENGELNPQLGKEHLTFVPLLGKCGWDRLETFINLSSLQEFWKNNFGIDDFNPADFIKKQHPGQPTTPGVIFP